PGAAASLTIVLEVLVLRLSLLLLMSSLLLPASELPQAAAGVQERYGSWNGEPFWLRLREPDERFGGMRVLELLYTPAGPEILAGTVLGDHPFLLLDEHLRLRAWNERGGSGSAAEYREDSDPPAYHILAEVHRGEQVQISRRRHAAPPAWDRQLLPLLVLLLEPVQPETVVPTLSVFSLAEPVPQPATITTTQVRIGETVWEIQREEDGAIAALLDADGEVVLQVGQLPPPEPISGMEVQEPPQLP
ncbi:MAG: hypothetical protein ACOCXJ_04835, partial [Planctomycetota bacterium]